MPEGKIIDFKKGEYPELDSVEPGQKIPFEGEVTVTKDKDGNGQITIEAMEFEVENSADRSLSDMRKQDGSSTDTSNNSTKEVASGDF